MEATVAGQILALEKVAWAFAEEVRKRDPQAANAIASQLKQYGIHPRPDFANAPAHIKESAEKLADSHNSVLSGVQKRLEGD